MDLIPHLFRTEFSKITSALCRHLGFDHLDVAEDIASETFLLAIETWPYKGIPENPTAWLYAVARNKTRNHITRNNIFTKKIAPELAYSADRHDEIDLSAQTLADSQLQMLFAICYPGLPAEAQVGLALRILCGFGIDEIAVAFLTTRDTINKRLFRAKEKLRAEKIAIEFPPENEIPSRLANVLTTLYLLFSEGYYSENRDTPVNADLCHEAMRLVRLLLDHPQTNRPEVNALFALMCFQASRLDARKDEHGEMVLYDDQDESRWNRELIAQGGYFLNIASHGTEISTYHLEAGIAYWHTVKTDTPEKWQAILDLFNRLLQVAYSPIAALNRTYALFKVHGHAIAIAEAEKLNLTGSHFYFTLLGELYRGVDDAKSKKNFQAALALAKTPADRTTIQKKLDRF
jgi:RNA polymerase sigma factor (sigma-70 family)